MSENKKLYPITQWQVGPVIKHRIVVFEPHFLTEPNQKLEESVQGQMYALTIKQAQDLIADLQRSIDILQKSH